MRWNPLHGWTKLGFAVLLLGVAANSYGQAEDQGTATAGPKSLYLDDLGYHVKGADIPRYHLVRSFLLGAYGEIWRVDHASSPSADAFYEQFLAEIGVQRGSPAEALMRRAAERYKEWAYGPGGPVVEKTEGTTERRDGSEVSGEEVFIFGRGEHGPKPDQKDTATLQAEAQAFNVEQAERLADIYYDFLVNLTESGVSAVERYLYNKIAAKSSLVSDEPLDHPRPYERAFEARLKARASGQLHSKSKD